MYISKCCSREVKFDSENHPALQVIEKKGKISWLGGRDSNPDKRSQSPLSYR